jgi:hypothetical protein
MADDEFLAFQAELDQLEAPAKAAVGPRAPQVITAKPQGPTPVKAREPIPLPQPVLGGPRVPVAQWPKPDKLVAEIQQEYPKNPMHLSALHAAKESGGAPSGGSGAGAPGATLSAAAAMSLGRLQPGQMPGDGTIKDSGSGSLAQVGEPRIPIKPVGGWASQQQEKPPPPPPPPPGGKQLGKLKADAPSVSKRTVPVTG